MWLDLFVRLSILTIGLQIVPIPVLSAANESSQRTASAEQEQDPRLEIVSISSAEEAKALADELIARKQSSGEPRQVSVIHIKGITPDPNFRFFIERLSRAGIQVTGDLFTRERFENEVRELEERLPGEEIVEKLLSFTSRKPASLLGRLNPLRILQRLNEIKNQLFGTATGFTLVEYWLRSDEKGKTRLRFPPEWHLFKLGAYLSAGAVGSFSLALWVRGHPIDTGLIASEATVAGLTFVLTLAMREISFSRMQGRTVWFDETAPPHEQLRISYNNAFFASWSFLQEFLVNSCILVALIPWEDLVRPMLVNAPLNAFLTVYCTFVIEKWQSKLMIKKDTATQQHLDKEASTYRRKLGWTLFLWGNLIFPTVRMINLVIEQNQTSLATWASILPFVCVGSACIAFEEKITGSRDTLLRRWKAMLRDSFLWRTGKGICADLLGYRGSPSEPP